ncbi:protein phosphatase 2C domain-containing protein [Ectothiorhodospiraceae bacterium BW-2]|nr:protein phosphatase 2C domain-containing protein [Ectothiorhodospiraceae bacterium BW-2]
MAADAWQIMEEAVVGLAHRRVNLPCQDAVRAVNHPRPALVVADGAGSSPLSHQGAQAVVAGLIRLFETLDKPLYELLDAADTPDSNLGRSWALVIVKHAMGLLTDLAAQQQRSVSDFRSTLLVVLAGQQRLLWLKVGDGALVIERCAPSDTEPFESMLSTLGEVGKGEFANQTQFLDAIEPDDVQSDLLDMGNICGMALMSDGAAERLISHDGTQVAARLTTLLQQLRQGRLARSTLTQMFYEESFCKGTSGDDRSLALAALPVTFCETTQPSHEPATSSEVQPEPKKSPPRKRRRKSRQ